MRKQYIILCIAFLSQTGIGVLGNAFLTCLFIFVFLRGHRLRPIDTILIQLALVNCVVLLSKGIPKTMTALGLMNFLDEIGCKIVFYLHRVTWEKLYKIMQSEESRKGRAIYTVIAL
uniref:Vomeronasal type-1 receptor n=1 Tax=Vombatus ursinus TaxID=29139 RepID=A0A4X2KZ20_VOMUR